MLSVAVVGASGFIGSRAVEMLHLSRLAEVRPVVRAAAGLASASRFDLDGRVADAFDHVALRRAFDGCEVVVHAVAGDRKTIIETVGTTYRAAEEAGVRRLIYLSSASVHGQAPAAKRMLATRPSRAVLGLVPRWLRAAARAARPELLAAPAQETQPWLSSRAGGSSIPQPAVTLEKALLYGCQYKLPHDKARGMLGYRPVVSFAEGCRHTVGWLAFAGYPVAPAALSSGTPQQSEVRQGRLS